MKPGFEGLKSGSDAVDAAPDPVDAASRAPVPRSMGLNAAAHA
jgi:hypothetical protein